MVQAEHKVEHKPPPIEHTSHIRNTPKKLSSVLNNRTLRDITHLLDPYKRNTSDTLITTLTHIILAMTEHTNSYNHLTWIQIVSPNQLKQYNLVVTARSQTGLSLQTSGDRKRPWVQHTIPQMVF